MIGEENAKNDVSRRFLLLFCAPFFLIGACVFCWGLSDVYEGWSSQRWEKVAGEVVQSQVKHFQGAGSHENYLPKIKYTYHQGGQLFEGDRVQIKGQIVNRTKEEAYQVVKQYSVGKKVDVFVNPSNPQDAVLEPGLTWSRMWGKLVFGLIFMGGILKLFFSFR